MNQIIIVGNLGFDPQCSVSKEGKQYATFSVGVSRRFNREESDWFKCVCFGEICTKLIKPFLKKGSQVAIKGEMNINLYETDDGKKTVQPTIRVEEIQILGGRQSSSNNDNQQIQTINKASDELQTFEPISDSELPF